MSYIIKDYTKKQALKLGVTVKPSKHKGKKIDVYLNGEFLHAIGALGMMDYPSYLEKEGKEVAEKHRAAYHKRHKKRTLGEQLALYLLW